MGLELVDYWTINNFSTKDKNRQKVLAVTFSCQSLFQEFVEIFV